MKGLKRRYWGEPQWPISLRDKVWFKLTTLGVGMLNVDDLVSVRKGGVGTGGWWLAWCSVEVVELSLMIEGGNHRTRVKAFISGPGGCHRDVCERVLLFCYQAEEHITFRCETLVRSKTSRPCCASRWSCARHILGKEQTLACRRRSAD